MNFSQMLRYFKQKLISLFEGHNIRKIVCIVAVLIAFLLILNSCLNNKDTNNNSDADYKAYSEDYNESIDINGISGEVGNAYSENYDESTNVKSLDDISFYDLQGMTTWVKIYNYQYDFDEGTVELSPPYSDICIYRAIEEDDVSYLEYETIVFENNYFYEGRINFFGEVDEDYLYNSNFNDAKVYSVIDSNVISYYNGRSTLSMKPVCDKDNKYLVLNTSEGYYVPIDLIDWSNPEILRIGNGWDGCYADIKYNYK